MSIWVKRCAVFASDAVLILSILFLDQLVWISSRLSPTCMMRDVLGIGCPVCGGTHAVVALASGKLVEALTCNWFVVVLIFYLAGVLLVSHLRFFTASQVMEHIFSHMIHHRMVIVFGVLAGVYWLIANFVL